MEEIKKVLEQQTIIFNLRDPISKIHTEFIFGKKFPEDQLRQYADFFDIELGYNLETSVKNGIMKNLECHLVHGYILSVLFMDNREEFDNILYFNKVPSVSEIIKNGPSAYYLSFGKITYKSLVDMYSKYELMVLASVMAFIANRKPIMSGSKLNIAGEIIRLMDYTVLDPRTLLTIHGVMVIHQYLDWTDMNINFLTVPEVNNIISSYYFSTKEPFTNNIHKAIISQFWPNFYLNVEWFREKKYAIANEHTTLGEHYSEVSDQIFFGVGDGNSLYRFFSINELITIWKQSSEFTNPISFGRFSLETIFKLYNMAGNFENGDELISIIDEIVSRKYKLKRKDDKYEKDGKLVIPKRMRFGKERIKTDINIFEQKNPATETIRRIVDKGKSYPEYRDTVEHATSKELSLYTEDFVYNIVDRDVLRDLFDFGVTLSDISLNFESRFDESLRNKIKEQIFSLLAHAQLSEMYIMTCTVDFGVILPPQTIYNTVRAHLHVFLSLVDNGLIATLTRYGNYIMLTCNQYHKVLYGDNIITSHPD